MYACLINLMGALLVPSCLVKELGLIAGMVTWLSIMCGLALHLSHILGYRVMYILRPNLL